MSKSNYNKGSVWRRWDLHIHTPGTKKNDNFEGNTIDEKWGNFIIEINKNKNLISVVGITDYFCLENYFKFKKNVCDGIITKKFDLILPNIELRITPVGKNSPINIHCIFNPEIDTDIEDRFLSKLSFTLGDTHYNASTNSLVRLGRKREDNPNLNEIEAKVKGIESFVVSLDALRNVFKQDQDLRKNTIIVVSNRDGDGVSGMVKNKDYQSNSGSQLDGVRESMLQLADAIFSSNESDREYFLGLRVDDEIEVVRKYGSLKPCFHGSDAHENSKLFKPDNEKYCWIKSDPTFEGLRQVIFEPNDRVKIQPNSPEGKSGYQVIDRININSDLIYNTELFLNPNLNSIIGGRSSGKSVLLGAIANKVKSTRKFNLLDPEYQNFVESVSETITVIWKDDKEENDREIEYFEQGYMHEIARNDSKLNDIIKDILIQKGKEPLLEEYNRFVSNNSKSISNLINDYYLIITDINDREQKIRDRGDKKGIEEELKKLNSDLFRLTNTEISEQEKSHYESLKSELNENINKDEKLSLDISNIESIKESSVMKDSIEYDLIHLSDESKKNLSAYYISLKDRTEKEWKDKLNEIIKLIEAEKKKINNRTIEIEKNTSYIKVKKAYSENIQLSEYETKVKTENDKLFEINSILAEVSELKKQLIDTKEKIKLDFKKYYDKNQEIVKELSDSKDGLDISADSMFLNGKYGEIVCSALNLKGLENQKISNFKYNHYENFELNQFDLFDKLENDEVALKAGYDNQTFAKHLFSTNFFSINYNIEYEGDKFKKMSDGKKAFVVLKLLLDFNDKNCPILIDQPEDDLDNRAIYNDLVKYIRNKKTKRQIIVATHNPNIVVGADSELVICANQNGDKNRNNDEKKFQYISGSLEHTVTRDSSNDLILESQGTREHVCEVLEGGNSAFKLREKKYSIIE